MTLGGFIQVGVAFLPHGGRVSLVCGGRCLIASCSLIPWHWLFKLGLEDLEGRLSNINEDLSQTDLKCCVTNCNGLFQNFLGQVALYLGLKKGGNVDFSFILTGIMCELTGGNTSRCQWHQSRSCLEHFTSSYL